MQRMIRHDAIVLHTDTVEQEFETFVQHEILPYFSETYRGPTQASVADLKGQSLLKAVKDRRRYLWVTEWDGSPDAVAGSVTA